MSFVFFTKTQSKLKITCPDCLEKFKNNANTKTFILGWWGFPWGFIKTIQALISNSKMSKQIWIEEPNDILKDFVIENIGAIEVAKNKPLGIAHLIEHANN